MADPSRIVPKNYFWKEKFMLRLFGLSFANNESNKYKIYSFLLLLFFNFSYPILNLVVLFKTDLKVIGQTLMYPLAAFVALAKTVVLLRNRKRFGKVLSRLEEPPFVPNYERGGKVEEELITECIKFTSIQAYVYCVGVTITWSVGLAYTLFVRITSSDYNDWQFSYGPFNVLNVTYSSNYEISWVYQNLSFLCMGCHYTTADLLIAAVVAHISYQFRILQNYITKLMEKTNAEMSRDTAVVVVSTSESLEVDCFKIPWKYLHKRLRKTVDYHLAILDIAGEMETVFNGLILIMFLGALATVTFMVFSASQLPLNDIRLIGGTVQAISGCMQVVMICYWGEQVTLQSQQVGTAAYTINFVGTDLRFQKSLAFIIRRSQYSTKFTAANFTPICMATFGWFIRALYSSFMVLRRTHVQE